MNPRKRLIELILACNIENKTLVCCKERPSYRKSAETIADHLLANGVIVPPVKVGDTVFVVSQGAGFSVVWNVYKATAKAIHLDRYGKLFVHVETEKENVGGYVEIERIFLTKEQAEKALAEVIGK